MGISSQVQQMIAYRDRILSGTANEILNAPVEEEKAAVATNKRTDNSLLSNNDLEQSKSSSNIRDHQPNTVRIQL